MNRIEFAKIMAYIGTAISKPPVAEQVEVYFDLLGDLPEDVLRMAAKQVCLEHPWPSFPSAAELRQAAARAQRGVVSEMTAAEAWKLAWRAACDIDPSNMGVYQAKDGTLHNTKAEYVVKQLPPLVLEAVNGMGSIRCLADANEEFARPQFYKIYESLLARENRNALLPPAVRAAIEAKAPSAIAGKVLNIASKIGQLPEGEAK